MTFLAALIGFAGIAFLLKQNQQQAAAALA